jgi:hypothetical protein
MTTRRAQHGIVFGCVLLLQLAASTVYAVDGVIEINQARALAGGVTPGDTAGFPVTISQPGSYRLTGNLDVRPPANPGEAHPENVTAILITSSNVTIDLNGFSILGPTSCSGNPLTCSPTGTGEGVGISDSSVRQIAVVNGVVSGMGLNGIDLNSEGGNKVEAVRAVSNSGDGILLGPGAVVTGNVVISNRLYGISASNGCAILGNSVIGNGHAGISLPVGAQSQSGYGNNVLVHNNGGDDAPAHPQVVGGIELGTNVCGTDAVCP